MQQQSTEKIRKRKNNILNFKREENTLNEVPDEVRGTSIWPEFHIISM